MFGPHGPSFFELARQALSSTERGYDLLAPKFEYTPFCTPSLVLDAVQRELQEYAPFDSAIDICCGTGVGIEMLLPHCSRRVTGVDFSQGMLNVAQSKFAATSVPQVELYRKDVLDMPFQDRFDLAISFGSFGHFLPRDQPQLVREIAKVLRPGGRFIFVTHDMPSLISPEYWLARMFNAAMHVRNWLIRPPFIMYYLTFLWPEVKSMLETCGFDVRSSKTFPNQPQWTTMRTVIATLQ